MAPTMAEIRAMSDEELIRRHDEIAESTVVGLAWYRDEIVRRDAARQTATIVRLTLVITMLTSVNVVAAIGVWIRG